MTDVEPGIKPLQEGIRFSATLLRQCDHSISGGCSTLRCNCLKRCIEVRLVRIKDLNDILVRVIVEQLKRVSPSGQYLPGDLDRLIKRNGGSLVRLVSVSGEFKQESKSND